MVVNTELQSLASGNLICSKTKTSIGECANEIIADLLMFHKKDEEMSATGLVENDDDRVKVCVNKSEFVLKISELPL